MSYSEFTINDLRDKFNIVIKEVETVVSPFETIQPSELLKETLKENIPLALGIDTEKARSELIVIPVLVEIRKLNNRQISLFSGTDLTVDKEKGLNGVCDFILSHSPEQMFLNAPIFTLVEAKNDNIKSGIPQCIAEMIASQLFNQKRNNSIPCIYGAVTTGSIWKFLKLQDNQVSVEMLEHFIENIESILGILMQIVRTTAPQI
ncbi:hypothetical protein [Calothrix sp. PCC 7507]|uniref:hypothetical protein n=1 Tax=Calothrix sp. PCC 7507 TaxID=99598 RepID=UPI00029F363E|nr:hypothetical protein [Calothrix sp. PCC 7507]AFY34675.1 hypothetical protein Cal7507_4299 [Calothrix sp. PCC 7507]